MRIRTVFALSGPWLLLAACATTPAPMRESSVPSSGNELIPASRIENEAINESSGIVQGWADPSVYWTHNDSGDGPRFFAIAADGRTLGRAEGTRVPGASAKDWEDIAMTSEGYLVLADVGNNANERQDLTVYIVAEPAPDAREAKLLATYPVSYPDQLSFPPPARNFDCEAVFCADEYLYFLTKHRDDRNTKLYRLEFPQDGEPNTLTLLASFPIDGQVTAADVTADGDRLAVLTYDAVWVFRRHIPGPNWFGGDIRVLPIDGRQCEAICWMDDRNLLITNEQRDIFRIPVDTLEFYRGLR